MPEAENGDPLTAEEDSAIRSLERLAKRWPNTLKLVSMGGSLNVVHTYDPRWDGDCGSDRAECILAGIDGIPNDGGDW